MISANTLVTGISEVKLVASSLWWLWQLDIFFGSHRSTPQEDSIECSKCKYQF